MATTYLINEDWIREFTSIGEWTDITLVTPWIRVSEEITIRSLIGKSQYDRLIQGRINNDLTTNENNLLDLIRPALAYDALSRSIPWISNQIRGVGVVKTTNANVENSSKGEVDGLELRAKAISDYYSQRVIEYLCENHSLYPLANNYNQDPSRSSQNRYGNFYFGDDSCSCGCGSYFNRH